MNDLFPFAVHSSIWTFSTIYLPVQLPYVYIKLPTDIITKGLVYKTNRRKEVPADLRDKGGTEVAWMS